MHNAVECYTIMQASIYIFHRNQYQLNGILHNSDLELKIVFDDIDLIEILKVLYVESCEAHAP